MGSARLDSLVNFLDEKTSLLENALQDEEALPGPTIENIKEGMEQLKTDWHQTVNKAVDQQSKDQGDIEMF